MRPGRINRGALSFSPDEGNQGKQRGRPRARPCHSFRTGEDHRCGHGSGCGADDRIACHQHAGPRFAGDHGQGKGCDRPAGLRPQPDRRRPVVAQIAGPASVSSAALPGTTTRVHQTRTRNAIPWSWTTATATRRAVFRLVTTRRCVIT